jgi:integrase/recombinase XerC
MSEALAGGVSRFLHSLRNERQLSPHTASGYGRDLDALLEYCSAQGIEAWSALDAQHVRSFAAQCHRRGLAPRSIQRRLSAARSFFRFLIREGELRHDPAADVQAPKARRRLPTTLDADTMSRLLEFRADGRLGVRDKAIMELF